MSRTLIDSRDRIRRRASDCADALVELSTARTGRPAFGPDYPRAVDPGAANPALFNGGAGTAWAYAHLARVLGRDDLAELAAREITAAVASLHQVRDEGVFTGRSGVIAAAIAISDLIGEVIPGVADLKPTRAERLDSITVGDGVAGWLLAAVRASEPPAEALDSVRRIAAAASHGPEGSSWPNRVQHASCGLANGNSGIAWALTEAAWAYPSIAVPALTLARRALSWERASFDEVQRAWPEAGREPATFPTDWANGSAGIGAIRLRLLYLKGCGVPLQVPDADLLADADAALHTCSHVVTAALTSARTEGNGRIPGGLTVAGGIGSAIDLMVLGYEQLDVPEYLNAALSFLDELIEVLGSDPLTWPAGGDGTGLFNGLAGTALVLARAGYPGHGVVAPSLLPTGDLPPWA
ncbi:MAG TPA: lanthionine synthetase LanC family protein [Jatrophihabitans sp.]|jgi:hypothetical protein